MRTEKPAVFLIFCVIYMMAGEVFAYDQSLVADAKTNFVRKSEGGRMGAFLLKPSLGIIQTYDDNIFRSADDKESDKITLIKPEVRLHSDWSLHQVEAGVSAHLSKFHKNSSENSDDFAFYLSGRYDIDYGTSASLLLKTEKLSEDRSSLDDPDGERPVDFQVNTAGLSFIRDLSLLKLYVDGRLINYTYNDGRLGTTIIDNGDRNRNQSLLRGRIAYSFSDNAQIFGQLTYDRKHYDRAEETIRDSQGFDSRLGVRVNITGKLEGEVFAGYLTQHYERTFDDIGSPSFGGSLLWNLTELNSLRSSVERRIIETTLDDSSGIVRTNYGVAFQHVLTPDILAEADVNLDDDVYEAGGSARDNQTWRTALGLSYQFGNGFMTRLGYDYTKRVFDTGAAGFKNSKLMASVVYAY